jgi:hypothetical protein
MYFDGHSAKETPTTRDERTESFKRRIIVSFLTDFCRWSSAAGLDDRNVSIFEKKISSDSQYTHDPLFPLFAVAAKSNQTKHGLAQEQIGIED